ncbi:cation:proton antiporter [Endozoicomonas euniceicola]|uniref:Cation:proton antiporter n=1 Tax=Endozoicomonas euniceicola TaxID=1234143 RepID=A0ABY6GUA5_9GAMM|nr:cation:proton antiporter [Endozoicomonas euniceicola]UYM15631.1 cation:proton antiporter [Endozoicomonas euniceicola]
MNLGILFFLILFGGWAAGKLTQRIKLPAVLGMVLVGVAIGYFFGNNLPASLNESSGFLKTLALIIILLKAGLGISRSTLKRAGLSALLMTFIPCTFEGAALTVILNYLFGFDWVVAGLTGFMLAAVSPAVVVPSMLELQSKGYGQKNAVPTIVLAGASVDDVFAITFFSICLGLATTEESISISSALLAIPVSIITGLLPGIIIGLFLAWLFQRSKMAVVEKVLILLTVAVAMVEVGEMIDSAALLGVMTVGFLLLERAESSAVELSGQFGKIWFFAQIILFVLIGMSVNIEVALNAGFTGLIAIAGGLIFRSIGVLIATQFSSLSVQERIFCVIAYCPKATVQAALGGVALAAGLPEGELILALAVLAIIFTAPLGLIGINIFGTKLLDKGNA